MLGWGRVCICMCKCGCAILSCVIKTGKARVQFYCFDLSWCPSLQIVPWAQLTMYFEHWLPRPQTMDTELLSQRLAECQYCLPEHMHGHAAFASLCICCQHSDQTTCEFTFNTNWITWIIHRINQNLLCPLHMQPAWVRLMKKIPQKRHTQDRTHKSQLQAAYNQKDIYCSVFLKSSSYHHFIEQPTIWSIKV